MSSEPTLKAESSVCKYFNTKKSCSHYTPKNSGGCIHMNVKGSDPKTNEMVVACSYGRNKP
jgi:hypothetical protein